MSAETIPSRTSTTDQAPASKQSQCYHCGLPVPIKTNINVVIDDVEQPMCCFGCQAVCQAILKAGLTEYYQDRSETANSRQETVPAALRDLQAFDNPLIQEKFVHSIADSESRTLKEASLILDGITCAACIWLNENYINNLEGVISVEINYATHRARVIWDEKKIKLSAILEGINNIGYRAYPYDPQSQEAIFDSNRKSLLKRIGVSAVLGMQVMILAVAMYSGDAFGMDETIRSFFRWVSLGLSIPIIVYAAEPFIKNALRDARNFRVGMDVSVSLAIVIAFFASAYSTLTGHGHVYYEAIAMFVFFLLSANYFELGARRHTANRIETITNQTPLMATLLTETQTEDVVPAAKVKVNDVILIRPGEIVPVDGTIIDGQTSLDESLMTGESRPLSRNKGDKVISGSVNRDQAIKVSATSVNQDTVLATLARLVDRAQSEKPDISLFADKIAAYFILTVLLITLCAGFFWWQIDPEQVVPIVIAILIVACPCALSLATPTAFSTAMGFLTSRGVLLTKGNKFQILANASHFIFDKTGTLTTGNLSLEKVVPISDLSKEEVLTIVNSLESGSAHPLAKSFKAAQQPIAEQVTISATNIMNHPGLGLSGTINNVNWYVGSASFIADTLNDDIATNEPDNHNNNASVVYLANQKEVVAKFYFSSEIRPETKKLISSLKTAGKKITLLTGDQHAPAIDVAKKTGIENIFAEQSPNEKLNYVKQLKENGEVVVMVGDGINDAPVLACADISIAMGDGAALAALSSDIVLVTADISKINTVFRVAKKTMAILKENLLWAICYNLIAITLALTGFITPWMAAIGMSASSLIVVLNSMRLRNKPK